MNSAGEFYPACRRLIADRSFSIAVVLTLAIGIGGNTAMFTLIDRVLFKPPPGRAPEELVWIAATEPPSPRLRSSSYPNYLAVRDAQLGLTGVAAFARTPISLGGAAPERLAAAVVTWNYFDVLGHPPVVGRAFRADESGVIMLSHALWKRRFGGDASVLGTAVVVNSRPMVIAGVAAPGFRGLEIEPVDVFVPIRSFAVAMPGTPRLITDPGAAWLQMFGRLQPDASRERVQAGLDVLAAGAPRGDLGSPQGFFVQPLRGAVDPQNRADAVPVLGLLAFAPLIVLFAACANAGSLVLASGLARYQEFTIRRVLGASRAHLVRQMLTESALLALSGGVAGAVLSEALLDLILRVAALPADVADSFRPDSRGWIASFALSVVAIFMFGLAPALASTKPVALASSVLQGASSRGGATPRLRSGLVVAQVASSCLLVVLAGVLHRSVTATLRSDPGFAVQGAIALSYDLTLQAYDVNRRASFDEALLLEVRRLPAVESAALTSSMPLSGRFVGVSVFSDDGRAEISGLPSGMATVSTGYLETMKIPLRRGRDFAETDAGRAARVAIVTEELATRLWPRGEALGHRLRLEGDDEWREVIGVAADSKHDDFHEPSRPFLYLPQTQHSLPWKTLVVRARGEAARLTADIRGVVGRLDSQVPLYDVMTLEQAVGNAVDRSRGVALLLSLFGSITLALAALGLHAVSWHAVVRGHREIGIRMSLGARPLQVAAGFVWNALRLAGLGLAAGATLGAGGAALLASEVAGVKADDLAPYAACAALVMVVTGLASALPAFRAARIAPWKAIREE